MSLDKGNDKIIRASAQILIPMGRASQMVKDEARLHELEAEKKRLTLQLKDSNRKWKRLCDEKDGQIRVYMNEVKDQAEIMDTLNKSNDVLLKKNEELKARLSILTEEQQSGWAEEKRKIETASFAKGFRFHATGFLANDPDYDFTKFGEETVKWISAFKIEEADAI